MVALRSLCHKLDTAFIQLPSCHLDPHKIRREVQISETQSCVNVLLSKSGFDSLGFLNRVIVGS
jgi:hypothetical protein